MTGFFVAAMVVALVRYLRTRERLILPLLALFTCLALAHSREWWDVWNMRWHLAAGVMGLWLLVLVGPRPRAHEATRITHDGLPPDDAQRVATSRNANTRGQ